MTILANIARQEQIDSLNLSLVDFIKQGMHADFVRHKHALKSLNILKCYVAMNSVNQYANPFNFSASGAGRNAKAPDLYDAAIIEETYTRLFEFTKKTHIKNFRNVPPPPVGRMLPENYDAFLQKHGYPIEDFDRKDIEDKTVLAWHVARASYVQSQQRILATMFLASQLGRELHGVEKADVNAEVGILLDQLYANLSNAFENELMFAIILGGEHLDKTRAKLKEKNFSPDTGIMQYLQLEGWHPSSYKTAEHDEFRSSLEKHFSSNA